MLEERVSRADAASRLGDVQGNVLTPHGRACSVHVLLAFEVGAGAARRALADFAARAVVSEADELEERRPLFANVFLSAGGYRRLGLELPRERCFRGGMKAAALNDPPVSDWDAPYRHQIDAVVLLAADDARSLAAPQRLLGPLADAADVVGVERGEELPGGIEHFGFQDNISQPLFYREDVDEARGQGTGRWDASAPLGLVLVPDGDGYGSYVVLRKLEQDVARFDQNARQLASALGVELALAEALIVGRFRDGTPVVLGDRPGLGPVNDFDYGGDGRGTRCPFASHVRTVNPRGEFDPITDVPDRDRRIVRRSIPYGRPGDRDVGMLFQCFQADIGEQFELMQVNWCNHPGFPRLFTGADALAGQRNSWDRELAPRWPRGWGEDDRVAVNLAECVTMRGGEYLFAPSPGFLRGLQ
jgi:Dyp-type peroxidase family